MSRIIFNPKKIIASKKIFFIAGALLLVSLASIFLARTISRSGDQLPLDSEQVSFWSDQNLTRLLDGQKVPAGQEKPFLIGAIIDNNDQGRPPLSLSQANLVYDLPAEGGIDRYLAFFTSDLVNRNLKIGPIRSVRPYFLDIASEYQALLLHCGGSPEALARIAKEKLLTLNEFYNSNYYERSSRYHAPHNVLARYGQILDYLNDNNLNESVFSAWKFKDQASPSGLNPALSLKNGQSQYDIYWEYDVSSNSYLKSLAGQDHQDEAGNRLRADNIILQFVAIKILDEVGRLQLNLNGSGRAVLCLDGSCREAVWKKNGQAARTVFFYEDGSEAVFNSGQTWIHLLNESWHEVWIENF